ncbi:hypothetical protein [Petroclostridium sp. X23]|uniref:hypothetical protein n=1 Tax=Petroclostridium sp. X23 TaxID=3045146 RepID=UPI0024ACBC80|nr:hypothetical protein [Petroclostridium sp. X23]WHH57663.1 hypothetical protein QKW49_17780 [Petroclostridium sp. X23]
MNRIAIWILLLLVLTSCSFSNSFKIEPENKKEAKNVDSSFIKQEELITEKSYKTNDEIGLGINTDIVGKSGQVNSKINLNGMLKLGVEKENDALIYYNTDNNLIESINMNTGEIIETWNIINNRKNKVYAINMRNNIVAWAECPYGDVFPTQDKTHGAGWKLYYIDLLTKKIVKIDSDQGIILPEGHIEYGYLAPSKIAISPEYISYITFDYNVEHRVTAVIKLYNIRTKKLEIIDYLDEDLSKNAFGYPNISNDKVVWCKALVNPDGTYKGQSFVYDILTKEKTVLVTDENVINPTISGDFICAEGKPGKTYYDGEVCIYNLKNNQWQYKINGEHTQYNQMKNTYLNTLTATDKYLLWETAIQRTLMLFNFMDEKLYTIISFDKGQEVYAELMSDNVLLYRTRPYNKNIKPIWRYLYLK